MFEYKNLIVLLAFCLQISALESDSAKVFDEPESDKNVEKAPTVMEKSKFWIQVHGSLMIFAWWGLNALSLFIAKYYRKNWPHKSIFKKDMWLSVHFLLNYGTLVLTTLSLIIIYLYFGELKFSKRNLHSAFGVATILITITQILIALARPATNHKYRQYWTWTHWVVGYILQGVATITIYFSTWLPKINFHPNVIYFFFGFTGYYFTMHIFMTVLDLVQNGRSALEIPPSVELSSTSVEKYAGRSPNETKKNKKYAKFRIIALWVFLFITVAYLTAAFAVIWSV